MAYKDLTNEDISADTGVVTSGIWQDGASSINTFFRFKIYNYSQFWNRRAIDEFNCPWYQERR